MAPQASQVSPTPTGQPSVLQGTPSHDTWIPAMLYIFLGLCLAYTFSYILYRIVMSCRIASQEAIPDSPDRGVSQFMNGARLTLNFAHDPKSTPLSLSEPRNTPNAEKPPTDSSHPAHVPTDSPVVSSSSPLILMPSLTIHPNQSLNEVHQAQEPIEVEPPTTPIATSTPAQQPFVQRVAAKVKLLSRDRAEAISLDPKLAPVQGPLRPLSMVPSPPRQKRLSLFGLGLKYPRDHPHALETEPHAQ